MPVYRFTTLICIMLLTVTDAISVEPNEAGEDAYQEEAFPQEPIYDEPTKKESKLGILDTTHHYISENVEKYVTDIDRFFANDALYKYTTDSYVQLSGDVLFEEKGETGYGANLRARVDMPGTKKRLKLIFDTDPKEKQDPLERSVDDSPTAAVQESDIYGAIQRERELWGWTFRPSVGVKFTLPLEPYVKAQFTTIYPLQRWALRADQNFYWFDDTGFGSDSTIEFDRPVGKEHLFRASSFARWTEEDEFFHLSQIFTFYQTLSRRRMVSYQVGAYGQTSPTWFMTDYLLVVRYRQLIHKEWLFFEIRPQVQYSKEYDWDDEVSLLLRLEMFFGRKYL
jgi:hypothetical protein